MIYAMYANALLPLLIALYAIEATTTSSAILVRPTRTTQVTGCSKSALKLTRHNDDLSVSFARRLGKIDKQARN